MAIRWKRNKKKNNDSTEVFEENIKEVNEKMESKEKNMNSDFNEEKINGNESYKVNDKKEVNRERKRDKFFITAIVSLLLMVIGIGLVFSYPLIQKDAQSRRGMYGGITLSNVSEKIEEASYGIYFHSLLLKAHNEGKELNPITDLFKKTNEREFSNYDKDNLERLTKDDGESLNGYVNQITNNLNSLGNIKVYAMNNKSGTKVFTNAGDNSWMLEGLADGSAINKTELEDQYRTYIVLSYDSIGKVTVSNVYGEDEYGTREMFIRTGSNMLHYSNYTGTHFDYEPIPIENMTYVYAIPRTLTYHDQFYYNELNRDYHAVNDSSLIFVIIAVGITLLLSLIIPFKFTKRLAGFDKFKKIPLEFNIIGLVFLIALIFQSGYLLIMPTLEGGLREAYKMTSIPFLDEATYVGNVLFWMVVLGVLFYELTYIKYMFKIGFKNFLKNHLLVYKFKDVIFKGIRKLVRYIKGIDLNKKSDKALLILIGINFILVSILCSIWFLGIIGGVIYSGLLFYFGRKYINKWKKDYNKVLEKTKEIADGNLEVTKDMEKEDLGFFNPLNEELNHIQRGFKSAVDEEVKSQRMKTELISNVSHDLRTPLTSIIAYIDLLKDEKDEEKRKAYLETLDKKSQRLQFLIEDLFEVSKATSGNVSLNIMDVNIVSLMKQVVVELDDKIRGAGLDIRLNFSDNKVILPLDSQRTYRIFENLIVNVVKYAMPNSRVYISLEEGEDNVEIAVKNISADEITFNINEISDRFVRGDKSRHTDGSGLGLAIVKSFVELQGGTFKVEVDGDLFKAIINFQK